MFPTIHNLLNDPTHGADARVSDNMKADNFSCPTGDDPTLVYATPKPRTQLDTPNACRDF